MRRETLATFTLVAGNLDAGGRMAKPLLSSATEEALDIIAHYLMAADVAKNVEGMAGFREFYRSKATHRDQKIISRFEAICLKARQDFVKMLDDERDDGGSRAGSVDC